MTTPTPTEPEMLADLAARTATVLLAAVDGDTDTVANHLEHIGEVYGNPGVYGLCCGLAEAVKRMAFAEAGDDVSATLEMMDGSNPDDLPGGRPRADLFAARFVTAHVNGDEAMKLALFAAAPINGDDPEQTARNVIALLTMAAAIGRHRLGIFKDGESR